MAEIFVEKVEPGRVEIKVMNILFTFYFHNGRLSYSKSKPDAQVYDPGSCWVPKKLFEKACQQAAAILRSRQ